MGFYHYKRPTHHPPKLTHETPTTLQSAAPNVGRVGARTTYIIRDPPLATDLYDKDQKRESKRYEQELAENSDQLLRCYDQHTELIEQKHSEVTASFTIVKAKLERDTMATQETLDSL